MNRILQVILITLACNQAVSSSEKLDSPVGTHDDETAAVLKVMDRYMIAISQRDEKAMQALQTPEGMTYRARTEDDGAVTVIAKSQAQWAVPANDTRRFLERYWSPTVMIRGAIAVVWAPYEFQIDGKVSHCGIDVWSFVKQQGEWRISNAMWTAEPSACAELYPADRSIIRP